MVSGLHFVMGKYNYVYNHVTLKRYTFHRTISMGIHVMDNTVYKGICRESPFNWHFAGERKSSGVVQRTSQSRNAKVLALHNERASLTEKKSTLSHGTIPFSQVTIKIACKWKENSAVLSTYLSHDSPC